MLLVDAIVEQYGEGFVARADKRTWRRERRQEAPSNRPLQQPNATRVRSKVGSCRDAAGCARGSSRPWYARRRPWRSLLNGRSLDGQDAPLL